MYEQRKIIKENKNRAVANFVAQKGSDGRQCFEFVNNRTNLVSKRKIGKKSDTLSLNVTQLVRRQKTINNVLFSKSSNTLHDLIKQWGCPANVHVVVTEVGDASSRFKVVFSRNDVEIDNVTAQSWVDRALAHEHDGSSSEEELGSSSDELTSSNESQGDTLIVVMDKQGTMTSGDSATDLGNGYFDVVVGNTHYRATLNDGIYRLG